MEATLTRHVTKKLTTECRDVSLLVLLLGSGDSSVVERRTHDRKVAGSSAGWQAGRQNFLLQGHLSVPTLISVSVLPTCHRNRTLKQKSGILPKVRVTAYS